jgi:hypothetical protein
MGRKKCDPNKLLVHRVRVRISDPAMKRLLNLQSKSNCRSMAEFLRRVLSKEKIGMIHRDMTLHGHIHELARIREELRSIGTNVNQITHYFNKADTDRKKIFYALEVAEQYAKVNEKVMELMEKVDKLGERWLQR